ncbi:uncharacterized protein OCT59_021098 [Rhizophagus irregularis]|uniref:uncharacterized protein n=1 Tax=Rhizophagus irregularis TaxID=588596 RepID=UPI00332CE117|nr:hypothetical protein OCT59_021098 [Rhizophagus irregularis]
MKFLGRCISSEICGFPYILRGSTENFVDLRRKYHVFRHWVFGKYWTCGFKWKKFPDEVGLDNYLYTPKQKDYNI